MVRKKEESGSEKEEEGRGRWDKEKMKVFLKCISEGVERLSRVYTARLQKKCFDGRTDGKVVFHPSIRPSIKKIYL